MLFKCLRRAVRFSAALLLFASLSYAISTDVKFIKTETSRDLIEKAYNLSLQKDRSQAINILVGAIKQENLHNGNITELTKALQQVAYLFYSDRAQQNFELAISLKRTDLAQAQQKIVEALRVEPDNLSVFNEMQRMLLIRGECSTALENISRERLHNPFDENLALIQAQAQVCLGKWEGYTKTRESYEIKKTPQFKFWLNLEIEYSIVTKNIGRAKEQLLIMQKLDPKYPESSYWQWRMASSGGKMVAAQKYIKECKNISASIYRQYMTDVNLCRKVADVENATKNGNGPIE